MSYTKRTLEELDLMDDFLMNAVASDPDVREGFCRRLLSVLLQKEIGKVKVKVQKAIVPERPDLRGIRMDVKVEEVVQERVTKPTEEQGIAEQSEASEEGKREMLESKREDILELLESYGVVPEEIRSRIVEERDIAVLKKWFQLATKIDSIEKFVKEMDA